MKLYPSTVDHLGGPAVFEQRVRDYVQAKEEHRHTVDVPAPLEDPLVEAAAAAGTIEWLRPPPPEPPPVPGVTQGALSPDLDLADFKVQAYRRIDYYAEFLRQQELTPGAGQAMEYTATETEARAWQFGESFDNYPFLRAEANAIERVTGVRPSENSLVTAVVDLANAWTIRGAAIKEERRVRKMLVEQATTSQQILDILERPWS